MSTITARDHCEPSQALSVFSFPITISKGMLFRDLDHILKHIRSEAAQRNLPLKQTRYGHDYRPLRSDWRWLRMRCRVCGIKMKFKKDKDGLLASYVEKQHVHRSKGVPLTLTGVNGSPLSGDHHGGNEGLSGEITRLSISGSSEQINGKLSQREVTDSDNSTIDDKRLESDDSFSPSSSEEKNSLLQWCWESEHETWVNWGNPNSERKGFPPTFLVISPQMQQNMELYGDILSFDIFYGLANCGGKRSYHAGLFTVNDEEMCVRFTGVAFFTEQSSKVLFEVFRAAMLKQSAKLKTIVTSDQKFVVEAIDRLKAQALFSGHHVLNSKYVLLPHFMTLPTVDNNIRGDLRQATKARSSIQFEQLVAKLKDENPTHGKLLTSLLTSRQSIFYCLTGDAFVGIQTDNWSAVSKMLWDNHLAATFRPQEFVRALQLLEKQSAAKCKSAAYPAQLQPYLKERFVRQFARLYGKPAVARLIENYQQLKRPEISGISKHTVNKQGKCECKEFEKTGVACSQMINQHLNPKTGKPVVLIAERWRKQPGDN